VCALSAVWAIASNAILDFGLSESFLLVAFGGWRQWWRGAEQTLDSGARIGEFQARGERILDGLESQVDTDANSSRPRLFARMVLAVDAASAL
jgi:hypothetical protein